MVPQFSLEAVSAAVVSSTQAAFSASAGTLWPEIGTGPGLDRTCYTNVGRVSHDTTFGLSVRRRCAHLAKVWNKAYFYDSYWYFTYTCAKWLERVFFLSQIGFSICDQKKKKLNSLTCNGPE